jgi:hypothetical protein
VVCVCIACASGWETPMLFRQNMWGVVQRQNGGFLGGVQIVSTAPPYLDGAYHKNNFNVTMVTFFFFYFFSLLLDSDALPFNFSKQPFNLFFLLIWVIFFWLLFILFEIIYKIRILFQFHPPSIILIYYISFLFFLLLCISTFTNSLCKSKGLTSPSIT